MKPIINYFSKSLRVKIVRSLYSDFLLILNKGPPEISEKALAIYNDR